MNTIFQCIRRDKRYIPALDTVVHEANTEAAAFEWLENNGGGIYRNILHNFECEVLEKTLDN